MSGPTTEHHLLFGVLGLHVGFLSADALAAALRAWTADRSRSLADFLADKNLVEPSDLMLLAALVEAHLRRHQGEPMRGLAALLVPGSLPPALAQVDDREIRDLLDRLDSGGPSARTECLLPDGATVDLPAPNQAPTILMGSGEGGQHPRPELDTSSRYRILRRHARGGLGEVFVAHDRELQREVALKEMQAQHVTRPENRQRFLLEGEVTGRLEHPGIVPVYGLGVYSDGRPFYVMRFIRGESLSAAIARFHGGVPASPGERALELRRLLVRFGEVCNAIAFAHSRGVLHRDIKPDNIMLGEYAETLVVDWGLAKVMGREVNEVRAPSDEVSRPPLATENSTQSQMGEVIGTPQYMSPEQASGRVDLLRSASDVFSLGATLYTLLTGERPFPSDPDVFRVLRLVQAGAFPPPREINPSVPKPLEAICLKAMALNPDDRYLSARDLAADVDRWLAGEPVSSYREPLLVRLRRWARRHKTTVTAAAVLCITAVIALAISYVLLNEEQKRTEAAYTKLSEEQRRTEAAYTKLSEEQKRTRQAILDRALTQVEALMEANPRAVPALIKGLEPLREQVRSRLREIRAAAEPVPASLAEKTSHRRWQTRAGLALLADDDSQVGFLRERLLATDLDPEECLVLCRALEAHRDRLLGDLWKEVERLSLAPEPRFRALVALAQFDPTNEHWESCGDMVVGPLLAADPLHVGIWTQALFPVRDHLVGPLSEVFTDPVLPAEGRVAATVLREYAGDRPELLVRLLADSSPAQVPLLLPRLQAHGERAVSLLRQALDEENKRSVTEESRDTQARRRANLAAVLSLLGQPNPAWKLLRFDPHPDARTHLLHLLAPLDFDPAALEARLREESDDGARRALVLALGGYTPEQLSPALRMKLTPRLLEWYRDHPDPGLHSAINWLLRHSHEGPARRKLAWEQTEALDRLDAALKGKPPEKRRWYVTPHGETMVLFGPAEFDMGSPDEEPGHDSDEALHRRRIDRTVAIAAHEVTVRRFQQFLDAHRKFFPKRQAKDLYSPEDDCPVVSLTWFEAAQFCRWLSEEERLPEDQMCFPSIEEIEKCKDGKTPLKLPSDYLSRTGYRMPTEAEWEYACRAGSRSSRPHGVSTELLTHYAWDVRNALARTWPVGQKKPNDLGLFDMHGNVAEWCLKIYAVYPFTKEGSPVLDGETVREVKGDSHLILRGAPFHPRPAPLRSAYRYWHLASDRFSTVGLRVVRTHR